MLEVVNYDFVGLTIDTSRASFVGTDYAVTQATPIFDGGTLKPTASTIFNQNFVVHATGGTIDSSNGNLVFNGAFSGSGGTNTSLTAQTTASKVYSFECRDEDLTAGKRYVRLQIKENNVGATLITVVAFGAEAVHKPGNANNAANVSTQKVVT